MSITKHPTLFEAIASDEPMAANDERFVERAAAAFTELVRAASEMSLTDRLMNLCRTVSQSYAFPGAPNEPQSWKDPSREIGGAQWLMLAGQALGLDINATDNPAANNSSLGRAIGPVTSLGIVDQGTGKTVAVANLLRVGAVFTVIND